MAGPGGVAGVTPGLAVRRARPLGWGAAMTRASSAALGRPHLWAVALATFLLRGGILVVLLPMVTLPTVATLTSLFSPTISAIAFGNPPPDMVAGYSIAAAVGAAWFLLAAIVGAWLDLALVKDAGLDEELDVAPRRLATPLRRAVAVRLLAHAGTLLAAVYATVRLVMEAYSELFAPGDATIPLVWRIALRGPDAIGAVAVAWLAGEALGGLAVRRVATGDSVAGSLGWSLRRLLGLSGLATLVITNAGVGLALLPMWLATSRTWSQVRVLLLDDAPFPLVGAAVVLLVASWALGLALLSAGLAWRSAAWTAEAYRTRATAVARALPAEVAPT